ncbi:MAG: hypothetical protein ACI9EF_000564 [Pseudohongiellaceae bacterium]|jgi:hypothetical protein
MKPIYTNPQRSLTTALCVATLLIATSPSATPFGDNDGGLDLPGMQDPGTMPPGDAENSTNNNEQQENLYTLGTIPVAGADTVVVGVPDAAVGRVVIGGDPLISMSVATSTDINSSTQAAQSSGLGVMASVGVGEVSLQGGLLLPAQSLFERYLQSPVDATVTLSFLIVDSDPKASLEALLNSNVMLDQWRAVDDPSALNLDSFALLVQNKADLLGPNGEDTRVTWLVATLDSLGGLHYSAARVSTLGGPIEVVTH